MRPVTSVKSRPPFSRSRTSSGIMTTGACEIRPAPMILPINGIPFENSAIQQTFGKRMIQRLMRANDAASRQQ
ncbi:hypothetical protein BSIN_0017 [Burkholderia singularis]|uniref:Uncharacterized protein n=1 Tax=Burkholderia singularis TaxID=1503053 RepID=A0A238H1Z6_9BURK|nr:hypothetical protein BSIN_0017 [Burkholderia singularis]